MSHFKNISPVAVNIIYSSSITKKEYCDFSCYINKEHLALYLYSLILVPPCGYAKKFMFKKMFKKFQKHLHFTEFTKQDINYHADQFNKH